MAFRYRKNKEIEVLRVHDAYHELQSKLETSTHHNLQVLQQRAMSLYRANPDDSRDQLFSEFELCYPQATQKLKEACPELTETERNIVILSFMGFRMKEEAEILHLSLNTVEKYRTNIRKKAGIRSISDLIR